MRLFKSNHQKKDVRILIVITIVAIAMYTLLGASWPLLLASLVIALLAFQLPQVLNKVVSVRVFSTLIFLLITLQLESVLFWALKLNINPDTYAIVTLLIVLAGVGVQYWKSKTIFAGHSFKLTRNDLIIALPAIIITAVFWVRTIAPSNSTEVAVVKSLTYGMDDASHMGIMGDLLRSNGNLLSRPEYTAIMTNPNHASYPLGWHVSMAVTAAGVTDYQNKPVIDQAWTYFFAKLFTLFGSVFALTVLAYTAARRIKFDLKPLVNQFAFLFGSLFVSVILLLPLYFEGFFSFLPILTFLLLFACVISSDTKRKETLNDTTMGLLIAASALSWVLTAPMLMLAMATKRLHDRGSIKKMPVSFYISLLIGFGAFLAQAYIMLRANSNVAQNITSPGGITNPEHLLLFISLAVFVYAYLKEKNDSFIKNLSFVVAPFALALAGLLFVLALKSPEITYYYFKIQVALLVLIAPLALLYFAKVILKDGLSISERIVSVGIFVAALGLSVPTIIGYEYTHNIFNRAQGSVLTNGDSERIISQSLDRTYSSENQRILFLYPGQNARTILSTSMARKSYVSQKCDQILFQDIYENNIVKFSDSVEKCDSSLPPITVFTNPQGALELEKNLDKKLLQSKEVTIQITE